MPITIFQPCHEALCVISTQILIIPSHQKLRLEHSKIFHNIYFAFYWYILAPSSVLFCQLLKKSWSNSSSSNITQKQVFSPFRTKNIFYKSGSQGAVWAKKSPSIHACILPSQISDELQQLLTLVWIRLSQTLVFWTLPIASI